ncbi:MAG: hypothetical protein WC662_00540 [Candidatus Paceibacterota bacterium]|jgi:hypothetical protein
MQSIKEIIEGPKISNWKGSEKTRDLVAEQVKDRWGEAELQNYNPETSALPYTKWLSLGYRPKRGSRSLKSVTLIEKKDEKGKVVKIPRTCHLFYYRQLEPISPIKN